MYVRVYVPCVLKDGGVRACVCALLYVFTPVCVYAYVRVCVSSCVCAFTCARVVCVCVCVHVRVCASFLVSRYPFTRVT